MLSPLTPAVNSATTVGSRFLWCSSVLSVGLRLHRAVSFVASVARLLNRRFLPRRRPQMHIHLLHRPHRPRPNPTASHWLQSKVRASR